MRLMAHSDDLRFQCYMLDPFGSEEEIDVLAASDSIENPGAYVPFVADHSNTRVFKRVAGNLHSEQERHFVLWDAQQKRIVGRTQILFRSEIPPRFTQSFIAEDMRGQHLGDLLYAARLRAVQETTGYDSAAACINKLNRASLKAAERNGFVVANPKTSQPNFDLIKSIGPLQHDADLEAARSRVFSDPKPRTEMSL